MLVALKIPVMLDGSFDTEKPKTERITKTQHRSKVISEIFRKPTHAVYSKMATKLIIMQTTARKGIDESRFVIKNVPKFIPRLDWHFFLHKNRCIESFQAFFNIALKGEAQMS